ncbi:hypothetical protein Vafri_17935 [Volvox africanus]|uniref:Uncharacterized protein n=1 Tax=Volvox africanus TaxID=51714 RepID=A0A8J4BLZ7_9CHLO|nr:hypothetical protein Vafri_17935 [Volvox africanus]
MIAAACCTTATSAGVKVAAMTADGRSGGAADSGGCRRASFGDHGCAAATVRLSSRVDDGDGGGVAGRPVPSLPTTPGSAVDLNPRRGANILQYCGWFRRVRICTCIRTVVVSRQLKCDGRPTGMSYRRNSRTRILSRHRWRRRRHSRSFPSTVWYVLLQLRNPLTPKTQCTTHNTSRISRRGTNVFGATTPVTCSGGTRRGGAGETWQRRHRSHLPPPSVAQTASTDRRHLAAAEATAPLAGTAVR